jgi:hypothetical protein
MTKRDMQASEYAAESYGKTYRKRCVSHMDGAERTPQTHTTHAQCSVQGKGTLTDSERAAIEAAAMSLDGTHSLDYVKRAGQAATLRSLLERTK